MINNEMNTGGASSVNPIAPTGSSTPISHKGVVIPDSVGKSSSTHSNKALFADSPELTPALYILWIPNQLNIPNGNNNTSSAIDLEIEKVNSSIVSSISKEWSKEIAQEAEFDKKAENSAKHQKELAERLKAGIEAFLSTLTSTMRDNMIQFNTLTGVPVNNTALVESVKDVISNAKAGDEIIPFMTGAVLSATTGTLAITGMQTSAISEGVAGIMSQIAPAYSVDLSSLANLYITGGIILAGGQSLQSAAGSSVPKIDFEFAKNYAGLVSKLVNSSDFNSLVMAIVTHNVEDGVHMDDKYVANAIDKLKIALLSTALSFLYYMESSFKGAGGGITGQEFNDLVKGNMPLAENDPKSSLVNQLKSLLDKQSDAENILASIGSWIDSSSKGLELTRVSPLMRLFKEENISFVSLSAG